MIDPPLNHSTPDRFREQLLTMLTVGALLLVALTVLYPSQVNGDIVAFTGGSYTGWETWNWAAITHLGFWTAPKDDVRARAKQYGVKLFQDSNVPDPKYWTDSSARKSFAQDKLTQVTSNKLDGVFFDYGRYGLSSDQKSAYVELAQAVSDALKPVNASVFVCVGGRPTSIFRDYDFKGLSKASDFLFIMGYDIRDDYTCVTKGTCSPAEAPIKDLEAGVKGYLDQVSPDKLVLGLPWYGKRYLYILDGVLFPQDQMSYADVMTVFDQNRVSKKTFDKDSFTWKIDCKGDCVQDKMGRAVWYDDATSLVPKYQLAKDKGLRGVGMWKVDNLPTNCKHAKDVADMWNAISWWNH